MENTGMTDGELDILNTYFRLKGKRDKCYKSFQALNREIDDINIEYIKSKTDLKKVLGWG